MKRTYHLCGAEHGKAFGISPVTRHCRFARKATNFRRELNGVGNTGQHLQGRLSGIIRLLTKAQHLWQILKEKSNRQLTNA